MFTSLTTVLETIMNTVAWNRHSSPSQIYHGQSCLILKMIPWVIHQSYVVFGNPPFLRSRNRHMTNFPEILKAFSNGSTVVNGDSSSRTLLLQLHNRLLNKLLHAGEGSQASFRSVYKKAHAKFPKSLTLIFFLLQTFMHYHLLSLSLLLLILHYCP